MKSLSLRFLSFLVALTLVPVALAHDVTLTGTQNFSALDGSSSDHDGVANGVFTVDDGNLVVNGTVNCNDAGAGSNSACAMAFNVSGDLTINAGGALYAENRTGSGNGGAITLVVGGQLALNGNAIISSAATSNGGSNGGAISATVAGDVTLAAAATIDAGSANGTAGPIAVSSGGQVVIDGNVLSGPSRSILATRLTGAVLNGGGGNQAGGPVTISSTTFVEPGITVGPSGNIVSQSTDDAAGPVTLDGCGIDLRGLVAAVTDKDAGAVVVIRSGKDISIDGRDLGAAGVRMGRVRADSLGATADTNRLDVFASETVSMFGPAGSLFLLSADPTSGNSVEGGLVRVISIGDAVNASGNVIDAGRASNGSGGGTIEIAARTDANLNTAVISAVGGNSGNPNRSGGSVSVRSHSGNVIWTNGVGDVRPVGSASGLPPANQGKIVLTACGTVDTTGSAFPVNGTATSMHPETQTGVCSPVAPSLPIGVLPLVTCNTPPVANDTAASTNEDTVVTITLSGSDFDGDSLTFTVVSGPSNGSLGPIISSGPTTATVDYTPDSDYNGGDSFVFRADDGNGGTDDATATITIAPVNDPPSFLAGPTVSVLEDSGPQTIPNWVTSISPGPADESSQTVTFSVTNDNDALFSVQPSVAPDGTLTFTPAANAYGSATITIVAQDDGGTANGGDDTSNPQTSTINVNAVNDEPSFAAGPSQTVNEDAGPQTVSPWATAISAGPNESGQALTFVTSNDNNALFSAQPSVASNGTLTYTPAANANGIATVSVFLTDDGGTANGGDDTSPSQTFTITVNAVNDEPSFTSGGDVTVLEDSGAYSAAWATGISAGPADESGQTVSFATSNDNNALFSVQPSVAPDGTLTFTVAANQFGSATVTIFAQDDGGTANGGDDTSPSQTFVINVTPVNDEPTFTAGGDVTVNEDSGAYSATWATAISAGPNESGQTLTFVVSNDNNALFASQPAIAADGTLTFTPAANANGTATVTVFLTDDGGTANGGDDTSPSVTFTITVNAVNDEPSFTGGGDVTVLEDSGAYSAAWATGISAGPADESGQTVSFTTSNDNNALFSVQPSVASDGTLTFTVAANQYGSATVTIFAQDDGGTANGGDDTSPSQTFVINVTPVNDEPSFTAGGDVTVNEDSGTYSASWATSISAGPNEGSQTVAFNVSNDNNALFASQPSISPSGVLSFTPAANAFGSAIVTVFLTDDGGTANGGDDTSASVTFTITVNAVNDEPTFTPGGNVSVLEDSGSYSATWATSISAGPNEAGQNLTFFASNDNNGLFSSQPAISPSGVLTFTVAPDAFGAATVSVYLMDDGGTANGGDDSSATVTFVINVDGVNDAPSFTAGGNVTVNEDNGPYSAMWATAISAGPANESGQTLTFNVSNDNNALFSAQPSIAPNGVLTFTPAANAFGTATVTVSLSDNGGTANGGVDTSAAVTFVITVNSINDPPTAGADSWATFGNTEIRVDLAPGTTPHVAATTGSGTGVLHNDADNVEGDPFSITSVVGCGDTTAPFDCTFGDGSVLSLNANGSFTFTPGPGATSASFQYVVTDAPSSGTPASATGTVTFTLNEMIWYVNGSVPAGGNGTSRAPFNNFASLNGPGGSGDVDAPNAIIFVHTSTVAGNIGLETNQRLLGEGVGLIVSSYTLVPAGTRPTVNGGAADTVSVSGVTGVEIAGLTLNSTGGNGIDVTSTVFLPASASIHDNVIFGAGAEGIDVNASASGGTTVLIDSTSITANGNGLDVTASAPAVISYTNGTILSATANGIVMNGSGNLTVTGLSNVVIDGNTAGNGITINGASFDAIPGGAFSTVSGGSIAVGASGNPVGGAGVTLSTVSGDYAIGSLVVFGGTSGVTVGGTGLFGGSTGMRLTNGGGSIIAPAGVGLSVSTATIGAAGLTFTRISSTGASNGISLNNTGTSGGLTVTGTGSAASGGAITGATDDGVSLNSTAKVSLSFMSIHQSRGNGIYGDGVTDFALNNSTVTDSDFDDVGAFEAGIRFDNLSGNASIANSTISGTNGDTIRMTPTSAVLNDLAITNSTIGPNTLAAGGNGIALVGAGSSSTKITVTGCAFTGNQGSGLLSTITDNASADLTVDGSTLTGNNIGVDFGTSLNGDQTFVVTNNTFLNHDSNAVNIVSGTNTTNASQFVGTISNNQIGNGTPDSGSASAFGIGIDIRGDVDSIFAVQSNTISNTDIEGIFVQSRLDNDADAETGRIDLTLTGNSVGTPDDNSAFPFFFVYGVRIESRNTTNMFLNISGNSAGSIGGAEHFRVRQRDTSTFNLERFTGVGTSAAAVAAFVAGENAGGSTASATVATTFTGVPSGTTRTP